MPRHDERPATAAEMLLAALVPTLAISVSLAANLA
jgi:hypothetical protein